VPSPPLMSPPHLDSLPSSLATVSSRSLDFMCLDCPTFIYSEGISERREIWF
jgi:hypothetical protein